MKADTSRSSFDPAKHYRVVLRQQGRVDVDADWNEQQEIADLLRTATTANLVGAAGGPATGPPAGFALGVNAQDLRVSAGHFYVDGLLVQNEQDISVWNQPDAPTGSQIVRLTDGSDVAGPTPLAGRYLVYLDVWDLHRTALEDGTVREVALGGPDTTTRVKTVWQVKLLRVGDVNATVNCTTDIPAFTALTAGPTGVLEARAEPADDPSGPCVVPAGAGFRGLENQHYRVEVHKGGNAGTATFKWARDNASIVASWDAGPDPEGAITVASPGRDSVTGFAPGMWVELIDDTRELLGKPGTLVQLTNVRGNRLTITPAAGVNRADFPLRPRVRRWDSDGALLVDRPAADGGWLAVEQGVQVRFAKPASYPTGAYWLVPARTLLADVLWPRGAGNTPLALPPRGITHHFTKLGLVTFDGTAWKDPHDCRSLFPHLTQLVSVEPVSGDGQTVTPNATNPAALVPLPAPIVVAVTNGALPVAGAKVRFVVHSGNGTINNAGNTADVTTDAQGLAVANWSVDSGNAVQQARAVRLDDGANPVGVPFVFTASLLTAARTAYTPPATCPDLATASTVQQAIDLLCAQSHPDRPKIKTISWTHAASMTMTELLKGLRVTFDRAMTAPDGPGVAWFLVSFEYDRRGFEADPNEIFVRRINAESITFPTSRVSVLFKPFASLKEWVNLQPVVPDDVLCRVVLKSHVLTDDSRVALDGDFLGALLPTGNGASGGDFESWFMLKTRA